MIISKLTKPVLFPTGGIGLRNAVAATKLRELPELTTPLPDASETAAVIFGSHHANGVNLWNNPKKQEQVLRQAVEGIFSEAEKLAKLQKLGTYSPLTRDVSRAVNTYLANIATVDYPGTLSDAPTVREINRKAIRKLYVSPTISRIIRETADNS